MLAVAMAACGGAPQDPVERLLDELSRAAEDRDAARVGKSLAEDFHGEGGMNKADALATLRRTLAGYERVVLQVYDLQRQDATHVAFRVEFTGKPKDVGGLAAFLPDAASYQFELELSGQGGGLEVRRASWRPWTPPESE